MNKKGFTLIELLAVLVILSIIMGLAIPNVVSTLDKSKKEGYITDAKKFLALVKTEISNKINKPARGEIVRINLECVDNQDLTKDPDGNLYSEKDSFVVIVRKDDKLVYYINLVGQNQNDKNKNRGIRLTESSLLEDDDRYKYIDKNFTTPTEIDIRTITGVSGRIRTCSN